MFLDSLCLFRISLSWVCYNSSIRFKKTLPRKYVVFLQSCHCWPPSSKLVFNVSFWQYIIKRWTKIRILISPGLRCSKRSGWMESAQKYSIISTWPQHILIPNLPPLEKIGKESELSVWLHDTLSENNKEDWTSMVKCLFPRLKNEPIFKNIIISDEKWILCDNVQRRRQ